MAGGAACEEHEGEVCMGPLGSERWIWQDRNHGLIVKTLNIPLVSILDR